MTLIIGIKCTDGVVLGSDGAATFGVLGQQTIRQVVKKKLKLLGNQGVVGVSGSVGIGQRFAAEVEAIRNRGVQSGPPDPKTGIPPRRTLDKMKPHEAMDGLRQALWRIISFELDTARVMAQTIGNPSPVHSCLSQSVACLLVENKPCLFQFDQQGMPEEATEDLPFVAIGSGQLIADPFLAFLRRLYWPDVSPNVEQGIFTTVWALHHAIETNPGGVGHPIQIITVRQDAAKTWFASEMPEAEWQDHLEFIKEIELEMGVLPKKLQAGKGGPPPPKPQPN